MSLTHTGGFFLLYDTLREKCYVIFNRSRLKLEMSLKSQVVTDKSLMFRYLCPTDINVIIPSLFYYLKQFNSLR